MFRDSFIRKQKNTVVRAFVLPISLVIHGVLVMGALVFPLLNPGEMPDIEVYSAFLAPPPVPPPPPPPPAKKRSTSKRSTRIKPVQARTSFQPGQLVAPIEIPKDISDEELIDIGVEGGIEGGVEGGIPGGILNSVMGDILSEVVSEVEEPVRAVGSIRPPKVLRRVSPIYPEIARQARVEGTVIVEATTDQFGRVQNVRVLRSIPLLDQAAVDAVKQYVFEPMVLNGKPRGVIFSLTVRFQLQKK